MILSHVIYLFEKFQFGLVFVILSQFNLNSFVNWSNFIRCKL